MKKVQDLGKKFNIIQDYPRFWQKNQDAKQWGERLSIFMEKRRINDSHVCRNIVGGVSEGASSEQQKKLKTRQHARNLFQGV